MTGMNSQNRIRYMTDEDVGDVCRIDAASFAKPWQQEEFIKAVHREDTIYLVADSGRQSLDFVDYGVSWKMRIYAILP